MFAKIYHIDAHIARFLKKQWRYSSKREARTQTIESESFTWSFEPHLIMFVFLGEGDMGIQYLYTCMHIQHTLCNNYQNQHNINTLQVIQRENSKKTWYTDNKIIMT